MKLAIIYFIFFNFHLNLFHLQSILNWNSFNSIFSLSNGCKNGIWHPPYKLNARPLVCESVSSKSEKPNDNLSLAENKSKPFGLFSSENIVESLSNSPDSMPSFTEWKKKMLSESGEQDQVLALPDTNSKITSSVSLPSSNIKGSNERVRNYASYECGAKVIASNSEAESTSRILNEMMDEYLLNPCKAKIWFVIELCESLRPSSLQLANFELFSSTPKDFLVFGSDQYPTHDWLSLGLFTAQDVRSLQRFDLTSQSQYLKYIKIEMLSNYGYEHYCPLSVIRIYGTSMVEEFDAIERSSRTKNVETLTEDEKKGIESSTAEESLTNNKFKQNLFGTAREAVINIVKKAAMALSKTPSSNIINYSQCDQLNSELELNLTLQSYLLKLISSLKNHYELNWSNCKMKVNGCFNCTHNIIFCNYLRSLLDKKVYKLLINELSKNENLQFKCLNQVPFYLNSANESFENSTINNSITSLNLSNETSSTQINMSFIIKSNESSDSVNEIETPFVNKIQVDPSLSSTPSLKIVPSSTEASLFFSSLTNDSSSENFSNFSLVSNQTLVNVTNESSLSVNEINKIQTFSDPLSTTSAQSPLQQLVQPLVQPSHVPINGPNVIPLSGTQSKESVFIRMSNKIRALEVNLSLSSQYLEELSQSYRKNMEEMQKAFNRTITKLNETARFASQQDDKQQEMLEDLQRKYLTMEERVSLLINEKETLHWHLIEMHIILLIIEIIIIIFICSICVRRLFARFTQEKIHQYNFNPIYFKSRLNQSLKRPNLSFDEISNPSPAKNKRTEENLIIVEPSYSVFPPVHSIKNKKRKKKKNILKVLEENKDSQTEPKLELSSKSKLKSEPKFENKMDFELESKTELKLKSNLESNLLNFSESNKPFLNLNEKFNFDSEQFSSTIDKLNLATDKNYHFKNSKKLLSKSNSSSSSGISLDSNLSSKTVKERQFKIINEDNLTNIMKNSSNNLSSKSLFNWKKFLKLEKK